MDIAGYWVCGGACGKVAECSRPLLWSRLLCVAKVLMVVILQFVRRSIEARMREVTRKLDHGEVLARTL